MAVDSAANVYVTDIGNYTIRKITPAGVVTTLAGSADQLGSADGTGSAARFYYPQGVAVDSAGYVYVADTRNNTIRKITPAGVVTTLAGLARFSTDGTGSAAQFYEPTGIAMDSTGNIYVTDTYNLTIRKITPAGAVTTLAGSSGQPGSVDGTGSAARFGVIDHEDRNGPNGVAVDSAGNVYVADSPNAVIRRITPAGVVTTLAGSAGQYGSADGTGSAARFGRSDFFGGPRGVAVDNAGNVYVADTDNGRIRKITPAGVVTTLASSAGLFSYPEGVAVDGAGNVYVADFSMIRKITPSGVVTTLTTSSGAGPGGMAVDSAGNLYVADSGNHTIRKITPDGVVTTLAGSAGVNGRADGIGSAAGFNYPNGVAVDSAGNLYVADTGNNRITKGTPLLLQFQTSTASLRISNDLFQMQLTGPFGSNVIVENSTNLQSWIPIQTNTVPPDGLNLSVPVGTKQKQFLRARLRP